MLFAAAKAMHVSPEVAVAKALQLGERPGWVLGGGLVGSDGDAEDDADVFAPPGAATRGGAKTYQPPGGEVQMVCPGFRAEHESSRSGFQALSCARVKFPEEAATIDEHVVVLAVTFISLLQLGTVP